MSTLRVFTLTVFNAHTHDPLARTSSTCCSLCQQRTRFHARQSERSLVGYAARVSVCVCLPVACLLVQRRLGRLVAAGTRDRKKHQHTQTASEYCVAN